MKIRTDFVTNSSSSSFIFKEFSQERVKKAVENKLSATPPENEWEEWYYEYASTNADKWTVVFILDIYDSYIDQ